MTCAEGAVGFVPDGEDPADDGGGVLFVFRGTEGEIVHDCADAIVDSEASLVPCVQS